MQKTSLEINNLVFIWLIFIAFMVALLVMVGGITRLTDSGLSITQWQLFSGIIPPLTQSQWIDAFVLYQQTLEYKIINSNMSLADFKFIYGWEWAHRFLARLLGLCFLIPHCWFYYKGVLPAALHKNLIIIFLLIVLQGIIGWWMVQSGLVERVDVSHIRLAVHLLMACFIFSYLIFLIAGLKNNFMVRSPYCWQAFVLVVLLFLQIMFGALLAGLDGGLAYNTWPKMGNQWIASAIFQLENFYENFYNNSAMVQFIHRTFAIFILCFFIFHVLMLHGEKIYCEKIYCEKIHFYRGLFCICLLLLQIILGITTLLSFSAFIFALLHQIFALSLLAASVYHFQMLRGKHGR